tara:strand:- start:395 stop:739 length:345 start_codon:yes stop_codon:yes gene_type:complete
MTEKSSFIKMMIMLILAFTVIIFFYIRMSKKLIYKSKDPVMHQYIIHRSNKIDYEILLHSIQFKSDVQFSAYVKKEKMIKSFIYDASEFDYINNILNSYNYELGKCSKCHHIEN